MTDIDNKRIVVIGGGTGSFTLLNSLKNYFSDLTAIVNMADDGGSTGKLRRQLDVLPPGDIRQCLIALSDSSDDVKQLFNFRYASGDLEGHALGNLVLSAAEKMTGRFADAVDITSKLLDVKGRVVPITLDRIELVLEKNDETINGEDNINNTEIVKDSKPHLYVRPNASLNPVARNAIIGADLIVLAPGDIYTSIGPALVTSGIGEALNDSKAKVVYVCNIMSKLLHTKGWSVYDHVIELERLANVKFIDCVVFNNEEPPENLRNMYQRAGEHLIFWEDERLGKANFETIGMPLIDPNVSKKEENDPLFDQRSYIRHDGDELSRFLINYLKTG